MPIHTVLGPIASDELGPTSMHEHLWSDANALRTAPREPYPDDSRVTVENLGFIRWNLLALEDNLRLDDPALAVRELEAVRALGGAGVVDLTVDGLGERVEALPAMARASGLHVMTGCGFYIGKTHPEWLRELSVDAIAVLLADQLRSGIRESGIRPALVGLIGTSDPIGETEERVLSGAARAAAAVGASLNVRLDPSARHGLHVLDVAEVEGLTPERVIFGNVDEYLDPRYLLALAARGAVLELCFGSEAYYRDGYKDPTDADRLVHLARLLEEGLDGQIVLGCSVWTKAQLRAYGGMGYDHLLRRIVPELERTYGVPPATVRQLMVDNPRRLLNRPDDDGGTE